MSNYIENTLSDLKGRSFRDADELLEAAGLDFDAELRPLVYPVGDPQAVVYAGQPFIAAIVHTDTEECLGVGSTKYGIVQYRQAFSFLDEMIGEGIRFERGGAPNKGERAFIVASLKTPFEINDGQSINSTFMIQSSHDRSSKLTVQLLPTFNGMHFVTGDTVFSVKHTKNAVDAVAQAKKILHRTRLRWEEFEDHVRKMVLVEVSDDEARDYIKSVVGDSNTAKMENIRNKIKDLWDLNKTPGCRRTLFGLVVAVTEWADRYKVVRASKYYDEDTAELLAKVSGDGARKKAKAWSMALTLKRKRDKLKMKGVA